MSRIEDGTWFMVGLGILFLIFLAMALVRIGIEWFV
jgi:hypothetical protein